MYKPRAYKRQFTVFQHEQWTHHRGFFLNKQPTIKLYGNVSIDLVLNQGGGGGEVKWCNFREVIDAHSKD